MYYVKPTIKYMPLNNQISIKDYYISNDKKA